MHKTIWGEARILRDSREFFVPRETFICVLWLWWPYVLGSTRNTRIQVIADGVFLHTCPPLFIVPLVWWLAWISQEMRAMCGVKALRAPSNPARWRHLIYAALGWDWVIVHVCARLFCDIATLPMMRVYTFGYNTNVDWCVAPRAIGSLMMRGWCVENVYLLYK